MNAYILFAIPLLSLVGTFLFLGMFSGLCPWEICKSFPDLLVLPLVGAYLLMLLSAGWLSRCADLWEPRRARDAGTRRSPTGSPRGSLSPRATTSST